jgi:hypothetical protein
MSEDIFWDEVELDEVKEALSAYALELFRLKKLVRDQADTIHRSESWRREQKLKAGFSVNVSFDEVWEKTLTKAKEYDRLSGEADVNKICDGE